VLHVLSYTYYNHVALCFAVLVHSRSTPIRYSLCVTTQWRHMDPRQSVQTLWHNGTKAQNAKRIRPIHNDDDQRVSNPPVSTRHVSDASNTHIMLRVTSRHVIIIIVLATLLWMIPDDICSKTLNSWWRYYHYSLRSSPLSSSTFPGWRVATSLGSEVRLV